jgi:predicted nucleic acid-binding protein
VIYLDSSVVLAALLVEDRSPGAELWQEDLVSSRLLRYEVINRLHAYGMAADMLASANDLLARIALVTLSPAVLERAEQPFPIPVRTLDALHLATAVYLTQARARLRLATYDQRMTDAARRLDLNVFAP